MDREALLRAAAVVACRAVEAIAAGAQPGVGSSDERILAAVLSYAEGIDRQTVGRAALRLARGGDDPVEITETALEFAGPVFDALMAGRRLPAELADVVRQSPAVPGPLVRGVYGAMALRLARPLQTVGSQQRWLRQAYLAARPHVPLRRPMWQQVRRPGDVRAAALLNATGLGAGYFYLGLWTRGAIALGGSLFGVILALFGGVAEYPVFWGILALVWIAAAVVDVIRLHRGLHLVWGRPGTSRRAVAAAAATLLVAGSGFLAYRWAGNRALETADAALRRGECAKAVELYDRVESRYQLTLTYAAKKAKDRTWDCLALLSAEKEVANGAFDSALTAYDSFIARYPQAANTDRIRAGRATAYLGRADYHAQVAAEAATEDSRADAFTRAIADLRTVSTDFGGAADALRAAATMFDKLMSLATNGQACLSAAAVDRFAGLDLNADVATRARDAHPKVVHDCGVALHREGQLDPARQRVEGLIARYPDYARSAQARALLVTIDLDLAKTGANQLGAPTVVGAAPAGGVTVEIVNDSPVPLRFSYRGPATDYVSAPSCRACVEQPAVILTPSCGGEYATRTTVTVPPGPYEVVLRAESSNARTLVGTWDLSAGTAYSVCVYLSKSILGR